MGWIRMCEILTGPQFNQISSIWWTVLTFIPGLSLTFWFPKAFIFFRWKDLAEGMMDEGSLVCTTRTREGWIPIYNFTSSIGSQRSSGLRSHRGFLGRGHLPDRAHSMHARVFHCWAWWKTVSTRSKSKDVEKGVSVTVVDVEMLLL